MVDFPTPTWLFSTHQDRDPFRWQREKIELETLKVAVQPRFTTTWRSPLNQKKLTPKVTVQIPTSLLHLAEHPDKWDALKGAWARTLFLSRGENQPNADGAVNVLHQTYDRLWVMQIPEESRQRLKKFALEYLHSLPMSEWERMAFATYVFWIKDSTKAEAQVLYQFRNLYALSRTLRRLCGRERLTVEFLVGVGVDQKKLEELQLIAHGLKMIVNAPLILWAEEIIAAAGGVENIATVEWESEHGHTYEQVRHIAWPMKEVAEGKYNERAVEAAIKHLTRLKIADARRKG